MVASDDIQKVIEQEAALVFPAFDELVAFQLGSAIRDRALRDKLSIVVDIQLWNRPLFYAALPGSGGWSSNWTRRKINIVRALLRSSYRVSLEQAREDKLFHPRLALDQQDYVLSGGGFPIAVRGAGTIGAVAVSGLHERDDHGLVVEGICGLLGFEPTAMALPAA